MMTNAASLKESQDVVIDAKSERIKAAELDGGQIFWYCFRVSLCLTIHLPVF